MRTGGAPFTLPRPVIANADIGRVIESDSIQSIIRPKKVVLYKTNAKLSTNIEDKINKLNPLIYLQKRNKILKDLYVAKYGPIEKTKKMKNNKKKLFKKETITKKI